MNKNKESTRYYSSTQEENIKKTFNGRICPNSGAGLFSKSDVVVDNASLSIECKTSMKEKKSFSIKKEWILKHDNEAFSNRLDNTALAISFEPEGDDNYYLINEKLMRYLVDKLKEDYDTINNG